MCIRIHHNGFGPGTGIHMSVYAKLLEGSYDAILSWPFVGTVTFTLLNQLSNRDHHTMTLEYDKNSKFGYCHDTYGYSKYISHSALSHDPVNNTQYLKNDTLYFRVSAQVRESKPWLTCTNE